MAQRLISVFDGSYDPESWLQAMEDYFEDSHILMEDYINICISCLRGEAKKWAKENESIISKNWCAFSYHLLWKFDPTVIRPEPEVDDKDEESLFLIREEQVIKLPISLPVPDPKTDVGIQATTMVIEDLKKTELAPAIEGKGNSTIDSSMVFVCKEMNIYTEEIDFQLISKGEFSWVLVNVWFFQLRTMQDTTFLCYGQMGHVRQLFDEMPKRMFMLTSDRLLKERYQNADVMMRHISKGKQMIRPYLPGETRRHMGWKPGYKASALQDDIIHIFSYEQSLRCCTQLAWGMRLNFKGTDEWYTVVFYSVRANADFCRLLEVVVTSEKTHLSAGLITNTATLFVNKRLFGCILSIVTARCFATVSNDTMSARQCSMAVNWHLSLQVPQCVLCLMGFQLLFLVGGIILTIPQLTTIFWSSGGRHTTDILLNLILIALKKRILQSTFSCCSSFLVLLLGALDRFLVTLTTTKCRLPIRNILITYGQYNYLDDDMGVPPWRPCNGCYWKKGHQNSARTRVTVDSNYRVPATCEARLSDIRRCWHFVSTMSMWHFDLGYVWKMKSTLYHDSANFPCLEGRHVFKVLNSYNGYLYHLHSDMNKLKGYTSVMEGKVLTIHHEAFHEAVLGCRFMRMSTKMDKFIQKYYCVNHSRMIHIKLEGLWQKGTLHELGPNEDIFIKKLNADTSLNIFNLLVSTAGSKKVGVEPKIPHFPRVENLSFSWRSTMKGITLQTAAIIDTCLFDPGITCTMPSKTFKNSKKYQDRSRGGLHYDSNMQKVGFNVFRFFSNPAATSFSGLDKERNLVWLSHIREATKIYVNLATTGSIFTVLVEIFDVLILHKSAPFALFSVHTLAGDTVARNRRPFFLIRYFCTSIILLKVKMKSSIAGDIGPRYNVCDTFVQLSADD